MSDFVETFGNRPVFLPVVHVISAQQALENARIAIGSGADGIFLINHRIDYPALLAAYYAVQERFPGLWIGLNCLDLGLAAIAKVPPATKGLWVDNAGISDINISEDAKRFHQSRHDLHWSGLYFGGVAFKYQGFVRDPATAAKQAQPYVDVITTSGARTGEAPSVAKIEAMRSAIGRHPLAIASGLAPENVDAYLPYADCFLAATKISRSEVLLDRAQAAAFAKRLGK